MDTVDNQIAIIGMAGRFPGASDIDHLWDNLCSGVESVTFFGDHQLDASVPNELKNDPHYVKARGVIDGADRFDASFFGISPREAQVMDPQQRLFLEVAWEALEKAGYDPDRYEGLIGVFGGTGFNTFFANHIAGRPDVIRAFGEHQTSLVNAPDYLTTRVSYKLNLRGPSVSLYTGCSTSLVAVCHACDSLMSYQCDLALAGASFVQCPLNAGYLFQEGEIFSPDGHCRPFDESARGTVFSDGVALVALKRLEEAVRDRDHIYAVILGSALNNDGSDRVSFTAPSVNGQAEVVAMAQANADVDPETISYIETHGTGTRLGDPIEISALTQAFRARTSKRQFCAVGSIKANLGHLDAAAGVAGLIKIALALHNKKLPPAINFDTPNTKIDFSDSPFYINTQLSEWKADRSPRRAAVSSFGVGGTNAHVILEEAEEPESSAPSRPWILITLSAKSETALESTTKKLGRHLEKNPDQNIADVAYTMNIGRKGFEHRRIVVCEDRLDALHKLQSTDSKCVFTGHRKRQTREVAFIFSGQGSQYINMCRELYEGEPFFRDQVDRCSSKLRPILSYDLREVIFPKDDCIDEAANVLMQTVNTQPALFTVEYALARLWMSWGIHPGVLLGHSIGEYVAACLAGVFSLEDALSLVATRGRLVQEQPAGSMLAAFVSEHEIRPLLDRELSIAVINASDLCVVSGRTDGIEDFEKKLSAQGIQYHRLQTSHAFHSGMMEPILDPFTELVGTVQRHPPRIPFLSNVTGTWITQDEAVDPSYWARHLRQTVRFYDCLSALFEEPDRILLEVGPGKMMSSLVEQHPGRGKDQVVLSSTRHPKEQTSDLAFLLTTLGRLWLSGLEIDWPRFYAGENRRRLPLPTYPFERERYWIEAANHSVGSSNLVSGFVFESSEENVPASIETSADRSEDWDMTDVERIVTNLWREILGIRDINLEDNYFELGGSSLMAVRMFAQIEKKFEKRLPLATLYDAPTIKQLSQLLVSEQFKPSWSSLVEIQRGDCNKPPVFFMHAEGGNVLEYYPLAKHLGAEQPFYALQAIGLEGTEIVSPSIEEMAEYFINEIKGVQKNGPYLIGGYCLGGLVAFEMTRQLQAAGEKVALLTLISTSTPDQIRNVPSDLNALNKLYYRIQERVLLELENLSFLNWREKIIYVRERFYRFFLMCRVKSEKAAESIVGRFHISDKWHSRAYILQRSVDLSDEAYMAYKPMPLDHKILLFRVSERTRTRKDDPYLGWDGLARKGIRDYEVYGFHKNILKEPNVKPLAEKLKSLLEQTVLG